MQTDTTEKTALKYVLDIEGKEYAWSEETITPVQIAKLGGWNPAQGVIEIDKDNVERTLVADEIIKLQPGMAFGKKHRWKRG
jgi:hypothetical protein